MIIAWLSILRNGGSQYHLANTYREQEYSIMIMIQWKIDIDRQGQALNFPSQLLLPLVLFYQHGLT